MTSDNFRSNPLFLRNSFDCAGFLELPIIKKQNINVDKIELIGYDKIKSSEETANLKKIVHFFLDDYKFECLWNNPEIRVNKLKQYYAVLSPSFSVYHSLPMSLQIFNTFRSRWCGAFLQSRGVTVIPTISWGLPQSYWYAFDGIEPGSVVAISTIGVRVNKEKDLFLQGYNEMLRRINPKAIICYSNPFEEMKGNIITVNYEETNNLNKKNHMFFCDTNPTPCFKRAYGYVVTAGMGSGRIKIKLHLGRQGKHMPSHNNYIVGRSIIYGNSESIQELLQSHVGTGMKIGLNKERVDFNKYIGEYYNRTTETYTPTTIGIIHFSHNEAHIVPAAPKGDK